MYPPTEVLCLHLLDVSFLRGLAKAIPADVPSEENCSSPGQRQSLSRRPGRRGSGAAPGLASGVPGVVRGIWGVLCPVPILTRSLLRYRAAPPAPRPSPSPSRAAKRAAETVN